jgi:hypothetical protein
MNEETNPTIEQTETNPSVIAEAVPPENPELKNAADVGAAENLATLTDDERDSYLSIYKGMAEDSVAALPPDMRREYFAIKEKISAAAEVTDAPGDIKSNTEIESVKEQPPAEEPEKIEKAENAPVETTQLSDAEKIKMLSEELRKANARYSSLQGKYNAEVKNRKLNAQSTATNSRSADTSPEHGETGTTDNQDKGNGSEINDEEFAEQHGLDVDVVRSMRELSERNIAELREKMSAISDAQRTALLDREVREATGGLSIDDVGGHPLFARYASGMKDADGVTAAQAIEAAKENGDLREVANIAAQVVQEMQSHGVWNLTGYSQSQQAKNEPAVKNAPKTADTDTKETAARVTAATPHSSGGVPTAQTARTIEQVEAELDAALIAFRRDKTLAPKIQQLNREMAQLEKQSRK